jgi:hypothetical protein
MKNPNIIEGVGVDAPTITNKKGGKQSKMLYSFTSMDPAAMFAIAKVLQQGKEKYGDDENWRNVSVKEHLNHLIIHAYAYLAGDTSDEHLSHIGCRALFALGVDLKLPQEEDEETLENMIKEILRIQ